MIQKRETISQKFCSFVIIKHIIPEHEEKCGKRIYRYQEKWGTDSDLRASITKLLETKSIEDEMFWFNYFWQAHKNNSDPLAERHILAYLDETCYWSAKSPKISDDYLRGLKLTRHDCLQIAREVVKEKWQILFITYNPEKGAFLDWFQYKITRGIQDELRKKLPIRNISDWRLLQCSKKALKSALETGKLKSEKSAQCLLAWQGFNEVYPNTKAKSRRQLPEPTDAQWEAITEYYNSLALPGNGNKTVGEVKELLQICISALRAKQQIQVISLDGDNSQILESEVAEQEEDSYLDSQRKTESSELSEEMIAVLGSAIASLPTDAKKMLILEHGLIKCTQKYIAQEFNIPQYQVSRLLSRYQRTIVEQFLKYLHKQHNRTIDNEAINTACKQADGWLNWYFQTRIIHQFLQTSLKSNPQINQHIPILRWYFGTNPPIVQKVNKLSEEFKLAQQDLEQKLPQVTEEFYYVMFMMFYAIYIHP